MSLVRFAGSAPPQVGDTLTQADCRAVEGAASTEMSSRGRCVRNWTWVGDDIPLIGKTVPLA